MHFACSRGNLHVIKALLHRGAFINVKNKKGEFPAVIARTAQHDACAALLEAVAGTSPRDC